jgi:hypothetical protein
LARLIGDEVAFVKNADIETVYLPVKLACIGKA